MIDDAPNVLILNDVNEKPEEIIKDYFESIRYAAYKGEHDEILMLLDMFWDEVNRWTIKQVLIDQTRLILDKLEELDRIEHDFIDEEDDDDDNFSHEL